MQLIVPFFRQPNGYTCMPSCLKMLLEYYGMRISFKDIMRGCRCTLEGTDFEAAAEFLASVMCRPILARFNPAIYPAWYRTARRSDIFRGLMRRLPFTPEEHKHCHTALLGFLRQGGTWKVGVLSLRELKRLLQQKRPVIVSVEARLLWPTKKRDRIAPIPHAILVVGYTVDEILFLDPGYSRGEISRRNNNAFLAAWYFDGGATLCV